MMKSFLRKNSVVYSFLKFVNQWKNEEFRNYIIGYRIGQTNRLDVQYIPVPMDSIRDGKIRYLVQERQTIPEKNDTGINFVITIKSLAFGFCSQWTVIMNRVNFADMMGFKPCVDWCQSDLYMEEKKGKNIFEYFFEPLSGIKSSQIKDQNFVVYDDLDLHYGFDWVHIPMVDRDYMYTEDDISRYAYLYNKYFKLKPEVEKRLFTDIKDLIGNDNVLGVHGRGGDMKLSFLGHMMPVTTNEYLQKTKELMKEYHYSKIFLATDDEEILESFISQFGEKVLFYDDVVRTQGRLHNCLIEVNREYHRYELGYEILRDVYTLAMCDSLVMGNSYVNCVARFLKRSFNKEYKSMFIIEKEKRDQGLNVNDPSFVQEDARVIKRIKEIQMEENGLSEEEKRLEIEKLLDSVYGKE